MYKKFRRVFTLVVGIVAVGLFQSVNADWNVNNGGISAADPQDVVVSLKSNPMSDPEMACLAVTFARSLSMDPNPDDEFPSNKNITLFVTLDGVTLADDDVASSRRFKCDTPWGEISLIENLIGFLVERDLNGNPIFEDGEPKLNHNKMVVCPLCWNSRYKNGQEPDYGVLPGVTVVDDTTEPPTIIPGNAIGIMIFNADKILDF